MNRYSSRCLVALVITSVLVGCARDPYAGWQAVASAEYNFTIKFPSAPAKKQEKTPDGRTAHLWELKNDARGDFGGFMVRAEPIPNLVRLPNPSKADYDRARDGFIEHSEAKLLGESDFMREGKVIGRVIELEMGRSRNKGQMAIVIDDDVVISITALGEASWSGWRKAKLFFKSFELQP